MPRFRMVLAIVAAGACAPAAAALPDARPRIVVVGHGSIRTDPDTVSLTFTIRGEGVTSDSAARELVRKRGAISDGLAGLLGADAVVRTGDLSIKEARDRACDHDMDQPKLSSGPCSVRGYVATMDGSLKISPVKDAGTALSLATRLGGSNTQLTGFSLRDMADARRRAEAAAIEDARTRAMGIAAASRVRLGNLVSVEDQVASYLQQEVIVTAMRAPAAPMVAPPPVVISIKPEPIETSATLVVTYAVEP